MLDNILNLIKDTVGNTITNNSNIPEEKKSQTIETATHAVTSGLKDNFTLGNISNLTNLFNGGTSVNNNPITNNITGTVTNALTQKVGLSPAIAGMAASAIVPLVMKLISGKVNDSNDKGFNIQSLIETFSGNGDKGNGLFSSLGKLFS